MDIFHRVARGMGALKDTWRQMRWAAAKTPADAIARAQAGWHGAGPAGERLVDLIILQSKVSNRRLESVDWAAAWAAITDLCCDICAREGTDANRLRDLYIEQRQQHPSSPDFEEMVTSVRRRIVARQ